MAVGSVCGLPKAPGGWLQNKPSESKQWPGCSLVLQDGPVNLRPHSPSCHRHSLTATHLCSSSSFWPGAPQPRLPPAHNPSRHRPPPAETHQSRPGIKMNRRHLPNLPCARLPQPSTCRRPPPRHPSASTTAHSDELLVFPQWNAQLILELLLDAALGGALPAARAGFNRWWASLQAAAGGRRQAAGGQAGKARQEAGPATAQAAEPFSHVHAPQQLPQLGPHNLAVAHLGKSHTD